MINENFDVLLIEVNENPCLEQPCQLLEDIIQNLVESVIRKAVDPWVSPEEESATFEINSAKEESLILIHEST